MAGVTQRRSGDSLVPTVIDQGSHSRAPVLGFELHAGETYDAALEQRRLRAPSEEPPILGSAQFENVNEIERLRVQRQSITASRQLPTGAGLAATAERRTRSGSL